MYELLSAFANSLGAPYARRLASASLGLVGRLSFSTPAMGLQRSIMGLTFPSPVGLAAGFDKEGRLYPALAGLGFGFAEIGSVVPQAEPGRSPGLAAVTTRLARYRTHRPIPLGVSVSMNRATPFDRMPQDYLACMAALWPLADYITLNLGVRAGPDLHLVQHGGTLRAVLHAVRSRQEELATEHGRRLPLLVKIDAGRGDSLSLALQAQEYGMAGVVLSGAGAEREKMMTLARVVRALDEQAVVIAVGGIRSPQHALDRLSAGARLVQVYSGLVQSGPGFVPRIVKAMREN